jgi:GNAT superfamily N-acetyltransferase
MGWWRAERSVADPDGPLEVLADGGGHGAAPDGATVHRVSRVPTGWARALPDGGTFVYPADELRDGAVTPEVALVALATEGMRPPDAPDLATSLARHHGLSLPAPFVTAHAGAPIRHAEPRDAAAIAAVKRESWRVAYRGVVGAALLDHLEIAPPISQWSHGIRWPVSRRHRTLVVGRPGAVLGVATTRPSADDDRVGQVGLIYLHPSAWGLGLGRALLTRATDELRDAGFAEALLWVIEGNERAIRFYERAGWHDDGGRLEQAITTHAGTVVLRERRFVSGPFA